MVAATSFVASPLTVLFPLYSLLFKLFALYTLYILMVEAKIYVEASGPGSSQKRQFRKARLLYCNSGLWASAGCLNGFY